MKTRQKNLILIGGVMGIVLGITIIIPSMIKGNLLVSVLGGITLMAGFVLTAIAFGD